MDARDPRTPGRRAAAFLLALAALAPGCDADAAGSSPAAASIFPVAPAPVVDGPLVAFLGDSIAAGLHLPADAAFPAVLQRRLAADGLPFRLVNAGVSGDTTAGGKNRIGWLLKQKPDVLVVELGGNDGLRGVPLATIEANLRAIVITAREAGVPVLLLGMRIPPSYGLDYAGGFAALYDRLAEDMGVPIVPFFMKGVAGDPALNLSDGIHPTAKGHERLADAVAPALADLLRALVAEAR